jgi:predicted Zn-dependent protease
MGPAPLRRALAALALASLAVGCATNPVTGRRELILMSPEREAALGAQAAEQVAAQIGLVEDAALGGYMDALGQRLAAHSPRDDVEYRFAVADMPEPNAFALPGGWIYVSRGLLAIANSEAELANVIGHEIGHVAARHSAKIQAHATTLGLATLLGDLMSGGGEEVHESENIAGDPIARYARAQERQADQLGQDIANRSGIEPGGMARFLTALDNYTKLSQGFSMPQTYFATHPATRERMAEAAARAVAEGWKGTSSDSGLGSKYPSYSEARDAYLDRIDGMAVTRPASEGVIVDDRFLHADLAFAVRFPYGWSVHNEPSRVYAVSPKGDGVAILELQGAGAEPVAAAREFATREGILLREGTPVRIGSLYGFRALTVVPAGNVALNAEITWVAHEGRIYRLIGGMGGGQLKKYEGLFRKFAQSFRPLSSEEASSIEDLRLRSVRARAGETLSALSSRVHNQWDLTFTSVVNNLFTHDVLTEGQRVKVAVKERYEPEPADAEEHAAAAE